VSAEDGSVASGGSGTEEPNRIADRVAVRLPVHLELDTAQEAQSGTSGNVSRSGMFVGFNSPPPVGTLARFEIRRPDGEPVRGIGEVVWIRVRWAGKGKPPGMGIRFRFMDEAGTAALEALIQDGLDRGLRMDPTADTDREAPHAEEEAPAIPVRHYGKPLMMSQSLGGQSKPASPAPVQTESADGDAQGWEALRKWANSPSPVGKSKGVEVGPQTDALGRTTTPLLGNLSDKAKLLVFAVLALILVIYLLF
jgi:PilZ domain